MKNNMKPVSGKYIITDVGVAPQFASGHHLSPRRDGWLSGWVIMDVTVSTNNEEMFGIYHINFPFPCTVVSKVFRTRKEARAFLDEVLTKAGA
jgi:hypothetical protein